MEPLVAGVFIGSWCAILYMTYVITRQAIKSRDGGDKAAALVAAVCLVAGLPLAVAGTILFLT